MMDKDKIKKLIEEVSGRPLERENELLGSGVIDSMMTMMLVGRLEEVFGVSFDAEDFTHHNFNSLDAIMALIVSKKKG